MIKIASVVLAFFLIQALNAGGHAKEHADHLLTVQKIRWLRKGIQAFPAIQNDRSAAVLIVNASLVAFDKRVLSAAKDCDSSLSANDAKSGPSNQSWTRVVDLTMRGPRYLSYVAKDNYFCGGAHPDARTFALVYDLHTGKLVDWMQLIASATSEVQTNDDGGQVQAVKSASLAKFYVSKELPRLDKDCADAIRGEDFASGFSLWPDANAGSLVVHPNLSYAEAACGEDVSLDAGEQRSVGVSEKLVVAIQAAHAALEHPADY